MNIWLNASSRLALGAAALLVPQTVFAQDAETQSGGIQEIVVTAQKKSENLQDVPISITAVGGEALASTQGTSLQALQGQIPNVQIDNFANTPQSAVFTVRGIGVIEPDPYAGNTVSIVVDGVPQFFSMGALLDLYDVDRIEVLRGPRARCSAPTPRAVSSTSSPSSRPAISAATSRRSTATTTAWT